MTLKYTDEEILSSVVIVSIFLTFLVMEEIIGYYFYVLLYLSYLSLK